MRHIYCKGSVRVSRAITGNGNNKLRLLRHWKRANAGVCMQAAKLRVKMRDTLASALWHPLAPAYRPKFSSPGGRI